MFKKAMLAVCVLASCGFAGSVFGQGRKAEECDQYLLGASTVYVLVNRDIPARLAPEMEGEIRRLLRDPQAIVLTQEPKPCVPTDRIRHITVSFKVTLLAQNHTTDTGKEAIGIGIDTVGGVARSGVGKVTRRVGGGYIGSGTARTIELGRREAKRRTNSDFRNSQSVKVVEISMNMEGAPTVYTNSFEYTLSREPDLNNTRVPVYLERKCTRVRNQKVCESVDKIDMAPKVDENIKVEAWYDATKPESSDFGKWLKNQPMLQNSSVAGVYTQPNNRPRIVDQTSASTAPAKVCPGSTRWDAERKLCTRW